MSYNVSPCPGIFYFEIFKARGHTMTKSDLVNAVVEKIGFSKKESTHIVDLIFEIMKNKLETGEKVKISSLGIFNVKEKEVRRGRNPATGESMEISARKVLTYRASPVLKKTLNR